MSLTHLQALEAESIHILREVAAEFRNPVMLYSIGKDSSVLLHLARKAFHPGRVPFPMLHVDTTWKFRAMYEFRDRVPAQYGVELLVHVNQEAKAKGVNPFDYGSNVYTTIMKTQGLIQALEKHGFDAAFGGARRDEEKSRAKERVYSFRDRFQQWDPKNQRPELWSLYNGKHNKGESIRVFPLMLSPLLCLPLYRLHSSGRWPFGSHWPNSSRNEKIRSLARAFSSSRRAPPMQASNPSSAIASSRVTD